MANETTFNLDDPDTWPMEIDGSAREQAPGESPAPSAAPAAAASDTGGSDQAGTPQGDASASKSNGESEPSAAPAAGEPQWVLTKDGKHAVPYDVLASTRKEAQAAREEARRLEAELAQLRQGAGGGGEAGGQAEGGAQGPASTPAPEQSRTPEPGSVAAELAAVGAELERIETLIAENDGDDAMVGTLELARLNAQRTQRLLERQAAAEAAERNARETAEQAQADEAFASSPLLMAWAADADKTWHERAVRLHESLLASDPEWPSLPWAERFARLPTMVEARYGESPHRATIKTVGAGGAGKAQGGAGDRVPTSMSQIPAGDLPGHTPQHLDDVTKLPLAEQKRLIKEWDSQQLQDWLFNQPIGSLNA